MRPCNHRQPHKSGHEEEERCQPTGEVSDLILCGFGVSFSLLSALEALQLDLVGRFLMLDEAALFRLLYVGIVKVFCRRTFGGTRRRLKVHRFSFRGRGCGWRSTSVVWRRHGSGLAVGSGKLALPNRFFRRWLLAIMSEETLYF